MSLLGSMKMTPWSFRVSTRDRAQGLGPKAPCFPGSKPDVPLTAGLLEDERLASAQQAEVFTKQIQQLQGNCPPSLDRGKWPP